MLNTFYITAKVETPTRTWYQLLMTGTHFCMSATSDLDSLLSGLKKIVKRYRTRVRLDQEISSMTYPAKLSDSEFMRRESYFQEHGKDYEDLVREIVLEALEEVREEERRNSPFNKTKKRMSRISPLPKKEVPTKSPQVIEEVPARTSLVTRKPRIFARR